MWPFYFNTLLFTICQPLQRLHNGESVRWPLENRWESHRFPEILPQALKQEGCSAFASLEGERCSRLTARFGWVRLWRPLLTTAVLLPPCWVPTCGWNPHLGASLEAQVGDLSRVLQGPVTAHSAQSVWVRGEAGHAVVPLMQSSYTEKGVWPWKQQ